MTRLKMKGAEKRRPIYGGVTGAVARVVDSAVGLVMPQVAHKMRRSRVLSKALLAYEAAEVDRLQPAPESGSADAEVLEDIKTLRARSRNLTRDDATAGGTARVYGENVIGVGVHPQSACTPEATGLSPDACEAWRTACEAEFERWAEDDADATGHASFYDLQELVVRTRKVDGECLSHAVIDGDTIQCELIDVDRLRSPDNRDTDEIRGGIRIGTKGEPVAYHVLKTHPEGIEFHGDDSAFVWPPRDAEFSLVQHVYRKQRAGQSRGVPDLSSAMSYMNHLHHYLNSELIAARSSSNYAMFIEREVSSLDADIFPVQNDETSGDLDYHEVVEPGTVAYLNAGEKPVPFNPNRPGSSFDPFVMRMLRAIAASQGMAYEVVARDFGGMNFSSMRGLLLECRRGYDMDRALLNRQFNQPWYENAIRMAIAKGRLTPPPTYLNNPKAFLAARWISPAYGWVDPTKEIQAAKDAIDANLSTPYDEAARAGGDAESNLRMRGRWLARAAELETEYGLAPGSLSGLDPSKLADMSVQQDEEGESDDDGSSSIPDGEPVTGEEPATMATKERLDALGLAVRAGMLSPSVEVESTLRKEFQLPPMSTEVLEGWDNNPVRRPVTIAGPTDDALLPDAAPETDEPEPAAGDDENPFPDAGDDEAEDDADDADEPMPDDEEDA